MGAHPDVKEGEMRIGYDSGTDGVAVLTLDDGKANAMSVDWFHELAAALDRAEREAAALVIRGRDGFFSAGLDLKLLPTLSPDGLRNLSDTFARTMLRVHQLPIPAIAAVTGHAIAGGAVLAFACDLRFALGGPYRLQLNEVAIGIPVPAWMVHIADTVVPPRWRTQALLHARAFSPIEALERGIVDGLASSPEEVLAHARAAALPLTKLPRTAYAESKRRLRAEGAERALARLVVEGRR
jgi:enoyl-CoA hydratase